MQCGARYKIICAVAQYIRAPAYREPAQHSIPGSSPREGVYVEVAYVAGSSVRDDGNICGRSVLGSSPRAGDMRELPGGRAAHRAGQYTLQDSICCDIICAGHSICDGIIYAVGQYPRDSIRARAELPY
jgi:hypothetical protein